MSSWPGLVALAALLSAVPIAHPSAKEASGSAPLDLEGYVEASKARGNELMFDRDYAGRTVRLKAAVSKVVIADDVAKVTLDAVRAGSWTRFDGHVPVACSFSDPGDVEAMAQAPVGTRVIVSGTLSSEPGTLAGCSLETAQAAGGTRPLDLDGYVDAAAARDNPLTFGRIYAGRTFRFDTVLDKVTMDGRAALVTVQASAGNHQVSVTCSFSDPKDLSVLADLPPGQRLSLSGRLAPHSDRPSECQLQTLRDDADHGTGIPVPPIGLIRLLGKFVLEVI